MLLGRDSSLKLISALQDLSLYALPSWPSIPARSWICKGVFTCAHISKLISSARSESGLDFEATCYQTILKSTDRLEGLKA